MSAFDMSSNPLNRGRHLLFILLITVGLTLLGIGAIAVFCRYTIPPIAHGPEFDAQFTVLDGYFYSGQTAKTAAYEAGCLATPFLLALDFFLARRWAGKLSDKTIDRLTWSGVVLFFLLVMGCAWPMIYCPDPPLRWIPPSWLLLPFELSRPFCAPARALCLLATGGLALFFLASPASRRNANRALLLLLALWAVLIPNRFYPPAEINDEIRFVYHLNSVLDSLSQSVNGHHLLVDFPHIYGGYGEMLAPIIRLFPREIATLIAALAATNVLGMLCLLLTARLVIRRPILLFVCGLAWLGGGCLSSNYDHYYGYFAVRCFFPPLGLLAATLYFRRPGALRYAAATAVVALAPVWNLDTGPVLWVSWLATLLAMELAARNPPGVARHLLIQTLSAVAACAAFFLYLRLASGQ